MTKGFTIPEDFEENIDLYVEKIETEYAQTGTISQDDLDWLVGIVQGAKSLTVGTALFVKVADATVAGLKSEIADLTAQIKEQNADV